MNTAKQKSLPKAKKLLKQKNNIKEAYEPLFLWLVSEIFVIINLMKFTFNFRKIKGFIFRHRISAIIIFVSILAAIGVTWFMLARNIAFVAPTLSLTPPKETRVEAPLTGELVDPSIAERRVLAVVIENHPDARPQSGYNDADIVYETLAEGGITRTLALFQSKSSTEIGPVRSARDYFIEWLSEFNGVFAHVGGSSTALATIANDNIPDLNQFANGSYYWRSNDRYAPHNVYTTTEKLYAAATARGLDITGAPTPFKFKSDIAEVDRPASQVVTVDFSGPLFQVTYTYDAKTNTYLRAVSGVAAKDKNTGVQIAPKNVIVMNTSISPYVNAAGEQAVRINTASGNGVLFQDGKATAISWSKASRNARTVYKDALGVEIQLNRGQTWIEVAPLDMPPTY